jgi:Protein of unknown function (DUF1553)/Protein of unknown function (DUF1549)
MPRHPFRSSPIRLALLPVLVVVTAARAADREEPVSFVREVLPLLTRQGCNAGACHGTPSGKNGFRLSLRGYDAALDITTLTREANARRIDPLAPDASLLLLKATAQIPHEGGRQIEKSGPGYAVLRQWIAEGGRDDSATAPRLTRLEVVPQSCTLDEPVTSPQLSVRATFADGSDCDVTHLARFSVNNDSVATVTPGGRVEKQKPGEVAVAAQYMDRVATARVAFLSPAPGFVWPDPPVNNDIDRLVFAKLRQMRIEPSGLCTDAEFIRRATLDVTGQLPTPEEVRRFLIDGDADKRTKLIDDLLGRPAFDDWWALKWTDRLGCNQRFVGKIGAYKYHEWIRQQIASNVPEDELARQILTASGGNYGRPAAGFYRRLRDPQARAEDVAQLFLGVRVQCAKCHNHPGESITQDDYYGLAAFFVRVAYRDGPFFVEKYNKEETVYVPRTGELPHPRTGRPVAPKFLGGPAPAIPADADRREVFAAWLTAPDNPFFARNAANRIWYHLTGRGIVDPVDDFRGSNPPSNPELLDALAQDLIQHKFDRKHLIGTILRSRTYQLSSQPTLTNAGDEQYFSHARVRPLQAEQLLDAIGAATGAPERFAGFPVGTPAVALPDGELKHPFLEAFGRPARAMACECERGAEPTFGQALHLVASPVVQEKVSSASGRVAKLIASGTPDAEVIDELFLATLSRLPSAKEKATLVQRLQQKPDQRRRTAEDVMWALLNHREFLFQR